MPEYVRIADGNELTAEVAPVRSTPYFLQSCREAHWVSDDFPATSPAIPSGRQIASTSSKTWPVARALICIDRILRKLWIT